MISIAFQRWSFDVEKFYELSRFHGASYSSPSLYKKGEKKKTFVFGTKLSVILFKERCELRALFINASELIIHDLFKRTRMSFTRQQLSYVKLRVDACVIIRIFESIISNYFVLQFKRLNYLSNGL